MKALVTASARFAVTPGNELWTPSASLGYHFWNRYLAVFDRVKLLVRAQYCATPPERWIKASGPKIDFVAVPYFVGPLAYAKKYTQINQLISRTIAEAEAIQLRLPCTLGTQVWRKIRGKHPYGVEVVGDPYDVFAPGVSNHPLRSFFRWLFSRDLQLQCAGASAVGYVTRTVLQQRYPPHPEAFATHYSSIELTEEAFAKGVMSWGRAKEKWTLVHVGSMEQLYKGQDVLIRAIRRCLASGLDIHLNLVGEGKYRSEFQVLARELDLIDRVHFCGQLTSPNAVREQLDQADLYIMPSRTEGLPKALLEAMARGLPCIGSKVGGIPELLTETDMVPTNDEVALAEKIIEVLNNPDRMSAMSERNRQVSQEYRSELLQERRRELYQHIYNVTLEHLSTAPILRQA